MNEVVDNAARRRFEMPVAGQLAFIDYQQRNQVIIMTHAEVPAALNGQGIGSALVKGALDLVHSREQSVLPLCSFVAAYLRRHPEYQQLLAK